MNVSLRVLEKGDSQDVCGLVGYQQVNLSKRRR